MIKSKFHINGNSDVKPCNASIRACRFSDAEHFENKQEAVLYAERTLSEQYSQVSSRLKRQEKGTRQFKDKINEVLEQNKSVSPESLIRVGEVFDEELQSRLSFDIYGDLSSEDFHSIEKETHKLMSEVMDTGGFLKNDIYGSMSNKLNKAVSVLPDSVKDSLKHTKILAKSIRKDAMDRDGQHMGNTRFKVSQKSKGTQVYGFEKEDVKDIPDGAMYIKEYMLQSEINSPYFGIRAKIKREGSDIYDVVWIGSNKSISEAGKKISDTAEVYVNNKLQKLNLSVYEIKDTYTHTGSVISAKKMGFKSDQNSVLLHEYVHLVQQNDFTPSEPEMFNKLRETDAPKYNSSLGESCYDGFPDEYMGLYNGRELLTRATEGLYYPGAHSSRFLYGKHRGKNADQVRQWIAGYWLSKDRTSR